MPKPPTKSPVHGKIKHDVPLAKCSDIMQRIRSDLQHMIVGEADNALLSYIVATSRLTLDPLALVNRGPSGAGKSVLQRRPLSLMPPETVVEATSLTPNALYYMEDGLEHKIISAGERKHRQDDDAADANAALRQLLSEKRISKWLPVKIDGKLVTKQLELAGPVAYIETTTAASIFGEDLNRMLQAFMDDSPEQTTAVIRATAKRYSGTEEPKNGFDLAATVDLHREFQGELQAMPVLIPYADALAELIPNERVEVRRVASQVYTTIETVVLLQQYSREPDSQGRLVATYDDYDVARRLLLSPLQAAIGAKKAREAEDLAKKIGKAEFTTTECQKACGFKSKKTTCSHLNALMEEGMVRVVRNALGKRPTTWGWTFKPILPEPKALCYRVTQGANASGNARKA